MQLTYTEISIQELIRFIRDERSLAIPEFQRGFVWDENDIAELLRTVINDHPAGTVLLAPASDVAGKLALTGFNGGPQIGADDVGRVRNVVLDGQQRLTSLYQAVTNNTEKLTFYVDMPQLQERGSFDDECLQWMKREDFPVDQAAAQNGWAPIHVLFSEVAFAGWLNQVDPALKEPYEALFNAHLYPIRQYKFPANTLPPGLGFKELVRIFDKLNRLGEPLSTFDLLVARMLVEEFRLRERQEDAHKRFASIGNGFVINGLDIIKLITLEEHLRQHDAAKAAETRGATATVRVAGIRESDVLDLVDLDAAIIPRDWDGAVERLTAALTFLYERAGASNRSLLPPMGMVLALSVGLNAADARDDFGDDLERWVWCTYFTQLYAQGVNTRAVADAMALREWAMDASKKPEAVTRLEETPTFVTERLQDSRKGNMIFVRGIAALVIADGAIDWLVPRSARETQSLLEHQGGIDLHHVFPDAFLVQRGRPSEMVVNFTPLKASTNRSIGKDAPSTVVGLTRFDRDSLIKHRIPVDPFATDDLEGYITGRLAQLRSLIAAKTGVRAVDAGE